MKQVVFLFLALMIGRCAFNPDTGTFLRLEVSNARDDGDNHYYASPASCAIIHWRVVGTDTVYITDPDGQLQTFGASGALRTLPLHSNTIYTLYVGGLPGEVEAAPLIFNTPASYEYPGNRDASYVDPSCE